jgi:hypothetical protein
MKRDIKRAKEAKFLAGRDQLGAVVNIQKLMVNVPVVEFLFTVDKSITKIN